MVEEHEEAAKCYLKAGDYKAAFSCIPYLTEKFY